MEQVGMQTGPNEQVPANGITISDEKRYKDQLEAIMEHSYDGIYISDGQGKPINMNKAFSEIIGVSREELRQLHPCELIAKGYIPESVVLEVLKQKKEVTRMINYRTGRETIVTGVPVFGHAGQIILVICNLRDLTDLKQMERELKDTKKLTEEYRQHLASFFEGSKEGQFSELITRSREMVQVKNRVSKVAIVDASVLITGETGVGKDVVARLIHQISHRGPQGGFVKVDCASIPEQLLEAELFGYEKGAFTDSRKEGKIGRLELAHNGTLFLDEIGELPLRLQVKLLNVLQDRKITRIGGLHTREINFRVICATNRDLEEMIHKGEFREDLYFRLNVVPIQIPPLRERKDDIQPLVAYFLNVFTKRYNLNKDIEPEVLDYLINYGWPGNVRQLANVIEQMVVLSPNLKISLVDLPDDIMQYESHNQSKHFYQQVANNIYYLQHDLENAVNIFEKIFIQKVINDSKNLKEAANQLGVNISTLTRKRKKYNSKN